MKNREIFAAVFILLVLVASACRDEPAIKPNEIIAYEAGYRYEKPDSDAPAMEINKYASTQWESGNYEEALAYFSIAYKKAEEENDPEKTAKLLNNIGLTYWKIGDPQTAMDSYEESGRLAEKLDLRFLLALTYINRALLYKDEQAFKTAENLNMKAINMLKGLNTPRDLAIAYNNHGQIFKMQSQMDSALYYYLKASEIYDTVNYQDGKSATYGNLAEVYASKKQKDKALSYAREALALGMQCESEVRISEGYQRLSDVFDRFSQSDSTLFYLRKYILYRERMYERNLSDKSMEYKGKLGLEIQKLRIENLEKEKEIVKTRMWVLTVAIFMALLCIAFFLYRRFTRIRIKKQKLETDLIHSQNILHLKQKELVSYIIDLSEKNRQVAELQEKLSSMGSVQQGKISELTAQKILTDEDWAKFKTRFSFIYPEFLTNIRGCKISVTEAELRYLVLYHLKLTPKEMAGVLGISDTTVHKYKMRLKKKLQQAGYPGVEDFMKRL